MTRTLMISLGAVGLALGLATQPGLAQEAADCSALATLSLPDTTIRTAELIDSGSFTPDGSDPIEGLPTFCRVSLTVEPEIGVEVWMPLEGWDGRFRGVGGGGYAGSISWGALGGAIRGGSAAASTDTGHVGGSGAFAFDSEKIDMDRVVTFASRSLIEMTTKSKAVVAEFYGRPHEYAYWSGCSTGGRQGLMQIQRTPDAYDGVLSGAPAINWERFIAAEIWPQLVMKEIAGHPITQEKFGLANQAALKACDANDGVEDGLLRNPSQCGFDPAVLQCQAGESGANCLTTEEATAITKIWEGPRDSDGNQIWPGLYPTVPTGGLAGERAFPIAVGHMQWVMDDPNLDWTAMTMEKFPAYFTQSQDRFNDVIGTDESDISGFRDAGGKLILWHGWADQLIFAEGTIDYYDRVVAATGGLEKTKDFARLFMAPGVYHCSGGTGPNAFGQREDQRPSTIPLQSDAEHDIFQALVHWVEQGKAPDRVIAAHYPEDDPANGADRTRPLCVYPEVAVYSGSGDINDASSFTCQVQ